MRRIRLTRIATVVAVAGLAVPVAGAALPAAASTPAAPPGVIAYNASNAGLEFHLIPGQYHPTFDGAFIESLPYTAATADTSPSASAVAAPVDMKVLNNYPNVACVISIFAPYCPYMQQMPVNTYFARASSDSDRTNDASTSFPCHPGIPEPPTAALGPPSCPDLPVTPVLADGTAHADRSPKGHAEAHLGPFTMGAPAGVSAAYVQRMQLAHVLLAAGHRSTAGVDAAAASGTVVSFSGVTSVSDFQVDQAGRPTGHLTTTFHDVDALGGMLHADAIILDVEASTLGEASPTMSEKETILDLQAAGQSFGNVDQGSCQSVSDLINNGPPQQLPGGNQLFGIGVMGFAFHCAVDQSGVVTGAAGFGLNPVEQDLTGPGLDFVQPVDPLDFIRSLGIPIPDICYPHPGLPTPPPLPQPSGIPLPGMPSSTCQFLSTNSFANNAFSLHFGHLTQSLTGQPPLPPEAEVLLPLPDAGSTLQTVAVPGTAGTPGTPGTPGTHGQRRGAPRTGTAQLQPVMLAGVPLRDWLLAAYGVWGGGMLTMFLMWAAVIHRRRREGLLR